MAKRSNLAAQFVAASAQALDCLRLAREHPAVTPRILKCTAQAANMMRQSRGARSLLLRVQADRQKREADNVSLDKAAWLEHCTIGLMADALGRTPPAPMEEPPPPPSAPAPVEEAEPPFEQLAEADQYAIIHPRRAALIRSLGGLPARCDFRPSIVRTGARHRHRHQPNLVCARLSRRGRSRSLSATTVPHAHRHGRAWSVIHVFRLCHTGRRGWRGQAPP